MSEPLVVSISHRLGREEAVRRLKSGLTSTSYTDSPRSGTFYYYVVAIGPSGQTSAPSNVVSATFK